MISEAPLIYDDLDSAIADAQADPEFVYWTLSAAACSADLDLRHAGVRGLGQLRDERGRTLLEAMAEGPSTGDDVQDALLVLSANRSLTTIFPTNSVTPDLIETATDTRTNVQPRPGEHRGPSRCSDRYNSEYISAANLAEIGRRQVDRWEFAFLDLAQAFCAPLPLVPPLSARAQRLCEAQGAAAVSSRLLERGTFTFRGGLPDGPGDAVEGTVDSSRHPRADENLGLRVPVGYHAYASAEIQTGDEELNNFHIATFQPVDRPSACDGKDEAQEGAEAQPAARVGAAMAYAPGRRMMVLFGGRNRAGDLLSDTWTLESGQPCWKSVASSGPPAQRDHVMVTAPQGEGVLFFGDGGTYLFDLKSSSTGVWVQLSTMGAPPEQSRASAVFDPESQKVWLLVDDLWSFEAVPNGTAFDYFWTLEDSGPPTDDMPLSTVRTGAGLVIAPKVQGGALTDLYAFGGRFDGDVRNDLWRRPLSGGFWTEVLSDNPSVQHVSEDSGDVVPEPRERMAAVYAHDWGRIVIFGGATLTKGFLSLPAVRGGNTMDTLELDAGAEWRFEQRTALPIARRDQAWALETPADGVERLVLFGGRNGGEFLDDTVSFNLMPIDPILPSRRWTGVIPPSRKHTDGIALGRRNDAVDVQWGRNDTGVLFDSPGASGLLEGFVGGTFPPIGNSSAAAIRIRFDHYRFGGGHFTRFLEPVDGESGEQGTLRSRFRVPRVFVEGDLVIAGEAFVGTIEVTNDIPPFPALPIVGCTLLLNAPPPQFPDAFIASKDVVIDAEVQLALDDRGPTADELLLSPDLAEQTHSKLSGVLVAESVDIDIPLCVRVKVGGIPVSAAELAAVSGSPAAFVTGFEGVLVSALSSQLGLNRATVDVDTPDGILGSLAPLAGARAVDAFTYVDTADPDQDLSALRTGNFIATRRVTQIQEPQWILLEDGLTLSTRTEGFFVLPFSQSTPP